jgi:hypothetical protein
LVEDLALHVGVQRQETSDLAVLLRDELLVERRYLDVEVERRKIEIGREAMCDLPVPTPLDVEGGGFVCPIDLVEIEEFRELPFAVVCEVSPLVRKELLSRSVEVLGVGFRRRDGAARPGGIRCFWDRYTSPTVA